MTKFELSYAEISTIHDALNDYLDKIKMMIEAVDGNEEMIKETVAYQLYFKFRDVLDAIDQP